MQLIKRIKPHLIKPQLLLFLVICLFYSSHSWAFTATATVDRNKIAPYETVELSVIISGESGEVDTSVIKDFDVTFLGRSSSLRIINTDVTRELQLKYSLSPRRRGSLRIPSLSVRDGSDVVRTNPIKINVVEPSTAGGDKQVGGDIMMTASVSNATPYVGQEIVYTFKFMAAIKVYKARYQKPSFEGFSVREVDDQKEYSIIQNGRRYSVTEVSYLLTPRKDGVFTIDSGVLTCEVAASTRGRSRSLFDDPFFGRTRTTRRSVRSEPVQVTVSPLPPYKGKGHFSGLIGKFELALEADPQSLSVRDSATMTLTVQGVGNIKDAPPPEFSLPDAFKVYPDTPEESVDSGASSGRTGTRGSKIFRYALVPTKEGEFELGPFELVTFDPGAGRYVLLKAGPAKLNVSPGGDDEDMDIHLSTTREDYAIQPKKGRVRLTGHDILSVRSDLDVLKPAWRMSWQVFLLCLVLPMLLFAGARVVGGRRRRVLSPAELMCRRADDLLKQASKIVDVGDKVEFLGLLHRALVSAVFARAGRTGESLTYEEARVLLQLQAFGVAGDKTDDDKIELIVRLLTQMDSARFGGAALDGGSAALLGQVSGLVRWLCKK